MVVGPVREIKIPVQELWLKMYGRLIREGGCICGTLRYIHVDLIRRAASHFRLLFCAFLRHSLIQKLFTSYSRIANGTRSNTYPYSFICRQCYQNTPSPLLMHNLSLSSSLYISPMLLHTDTNFPTYCLHRVMFVTAKFHHRSLSKLRSKTLLVLNSATRHQLSSNSKDGNHSWTYLFNG